MAGCCVPRMSTASCVPIGLRRGSDVGHRDRPLERRRERAARDFADDLAVVQHGAALPRHALAVELQADADRLRSCRRRIVRAPRVPMNSRPSRFTAKFKPGLNWIDRLRQLVAVQRHRRFEPQRVAGAETGSHAADGRQLPR